MTGTAEQSARTGNVADWRQGRSLVADVSVKTGRRKEAYVLHQVNLAPTSSSFTQRFAGRFVGSAGSVHYGVSAGWKCQRGDPYQFLFLPALGRRLLQRSERNRGIVDVRGMTTWHVRVTGYDPLAAFTTEGPEVYDYFIQTRTFRLVEQAARATSALSGGSAITERNVLMFSRYGEGVSVTIPARCRLK